MSFRVVGIVNSYVLVVSFGGTLVTATEIVEGRKSERKRRID